jgi:single-strand DNA-binding protein
MELIGRVTANATVNTTKDGRKVVHFSIAMNDSYKPKDSDEWKKLTTFVNCSYWMREGIAKHLLKGSLVEVYGRISVSAWTNVQGEAKGSLNFHVNNIKLHGKGNAEPTESIPDPSEITEPIEDLPF